MDAVEPGDLDGLAGWALRSCGLDLDEPPNPVIVARKLVGPVHRIHGVPLPGDAALVQVGDERMIYVRGRIGQRRMRWAILHEVAESLLLDSGVSAADAEASAEALAARLAAPSSFALRECKRIGPMYEQLALALNFDQTGAALRYGEVLHVPVAVVAPQRCHVRGVPATWAADETILRRLAKAPPPDLVVDRLTDAPRRIVLRAG